ncbi:MAG: response regulator [Planctomycetota bacterium]
MINLSDILNAKVLIVDDQEANVHLLERMLRGANYVSIASTMDPSKVCELHLKNHYDLILLDLLMPGMDGFQVMEGLKEIEPDGYLPVLVITAQPGHKLRAFQAGAKDFISKPFELPEVLTRVHNMLEIRLLYGETKNYSKALEQMVTKVESSHDLIRRQFAQLMESDSQLSITAQKDSVSHILQAGWHLLKLINEILDLTKVESVPMPLLLEPVPLDKAISVDEPQISIKHSNS